MLSADDAASVLAVVGAVAADPVGAFSFVAVVLLLFVVLSAGVTLSVSVAGLSVVPLLVDSTSGLSIVPLPVAELSVDASTLELLLAVGLLFASSVDGLFVDVAVVSPVAASLLFGVVGEASALPLSVVSDTLGCPVFSGVALAFEFAVASLLSVPLLVSLASDHSEAQSLQLQVSLHFVIQQLLHLFVFYLNYQQICQNIYLNPYVQFLSPMHLHF